MPVTNYIWDELSDNVLMETDENDALVANYTCEPSQFGEVLSQHRDDRDHYFSYDGLGSTRNLTRQNQAVSDSYTYTAFGETVTSSGSTTNPFQYNGAVGYYTNEETGDFYVRRRTYDPSMARWMSRDPLGFVDGPNVYSYVANFVPNRLDPEGLAACGCEDPDDVVCCKVCKSFVSFRESIDGLDGFVVGTPFNDLNIYQHSLLVGDLAPFKPANLPTHAGPWTLDNAPPSPPTKKYLAYLFFVSFAIWEKEPGDCRLFLDETGSNTKVWFRDDPVIDMNGSNHFDITEHPDVRSAKLKTPIDCCDTVLIFVDRPTLAGASRVDGTWFRAEHTTLQKFEVKDRKSNTTVHTLHNSVMLKISAEGVTSFVP